MSRSLMDSPRHLHVTNNERTQNQERAFNLSTLTVSVPCDFSHVESNFLKPQAPLLVVPLRPYSLPEPQNFEFSMNTTLENAYTQRRRQQTNSSTATATAATATTVNEGWQQ